MSKDRNRDLIVSLDIGTSKIVAIVAEQTGDEELSILGIGTQDTQELRGLKRGVVVNIEATVNSISKAIAEVEMLYPTVSMPIAIALFDLGAPLISNGEEGGE